MRTGRLALAAALAAALGCEARPPPPPAAPGPADKIAPRDRLSVTRGEVASRPEGRIVVDAPTTRAVARGGTGASAALRFTYLGVTSRTDTLSSGEVRSQVGLKLLAEDGCNLLYVMWRAGERGGVVVQSKRNRGRSTSFECGAEGYRTLASTPLHPSRPLDVGEHDLRARIDHGRLEVEADGVVVWEGDVSAAIAGLRGPAGLRTDNARVEGVFSTD